MKIPELKLGDLKVRIPIIQGGMGVGISLSGLAAAVANEGGIGVIASAMIGMSEPDIFDNCREANGRALRREIRKARELTDGILGINIMGALTNYEDIVKLAIENGNQSIIICRTLLLWKVLWQGGILVLNLNSLMIRRLPWKTLCLKLLRL